jgi:glycosyltransferase involved in cell wall biosynthesis
METSETGLKAPVDGQLSPSHPYISIVVPAYNEALRIGPSIEGILRFIDARQFEAEVILVDDGSVDDTSKIASAFPLRIIRNGSNRGKGYSVQRGVLEAKGAWVLFTDADLSAPIEELDSLLEVGEKGADVVIGSRAVDRSKISVHQSRFREMGGIFYNLTVRLTLGLPIQDTQCGFKLFRRETTSQVFRNQTIHGFGFDPEILFLAKRQGLTIREVPVAWSHDAGSKVHFFSDGLEMFLDLARIRWNALRGSYGEKLKVTSDE